MADVFLIARQGADIARALERVPPKALLLLRDGEGYDDWVRLVAPVAQGKDVAVLIEGEPKDVTALGADGLHVTTGLPAIKAAIAALKPRFIVGAGGVDGSDDAMSFGEAGADYVFFGPTSGSIDEKTRELARWWAETMEVPGVLSDPQATVETAADEGCEFIGLGEAAWR